MEAMAVPRHLSVLALLLVTACTGAASSELFDPVSDERSPTEPSSPGADPGSSSSGSSSGGATSSSSSSSSSSSGGSSSGSTSSGGTQKDAGPPPPPPPPACQSESEPNDSMQNADVFKSCVTGVIKGRDIDYLSTVAPATAKQIGIVHNETGGKIAYRVFVNGVPYPAFTDEPPASIPAVPNATYVFQLQPSGQSTTGDRTYELEVSFQ